MVRKEVLSNGLTLLVEQVPGVRSASIGVWLRMGSRHETDALSGICHFIEHLVFKGTTNRSAREISLLTDRMGGNLDAFTTKEMTCFYARVLDEHVPMAVDLLGDIVRHPLFDGEELERERRVILEEIRMVLDSPEDRVHDLFCEEFWPGSPLGRPIQGTEQTVRGMSRQTVLRWFRKAYVPQNLVVAASGRLRSADQRALRETFGALNAGKPARTGRGPRWRPGIRLEHRRELEQVHLLFGVPALPAGHQDRFAMHILNTMLGGSISSRLFQRVREERGLVYSIASHVQAFSQAGLLTVYAGTSPHNARDVLELSLQAMRELASEVPPEDELDVARDHLKGNLLLALESTTSRMSRAAREQIVLGRQMSVDEIAEQLAAVGPKDIRRVARKLFRDKQLALAAVGRTRGMRLREKELRL
ncbi:MAG: insulinase family protein [Acidobacteriota bacterium]|nr:MAG: insulinase family protein [Acidobacteriota bacterium]